MVTSAELAELFKEMPSPVKDVFESFVEIANGRSAHGRISDDDLSYFYDKGHSLVVVAYSLDWLSKRNFLVKRQDKNADGSYDIIYWRLGDAGFDFLFNSDLGPGSIVSPSDSEIYRPLELDRTSPQTEEAIQLLEEVIDKVRGNNGLEEHHRSSLIWSIKAGIAGVRESFPTGEQLKSTIYKPLRWLMEQFARAELGEIARRAHDAVAKLGWF